MIQKLKKPALIAISIGILAGIGYLAYAISSQFSSIGKQKSDYDPKAYFEFTTSDFFTESGEFGPGESKGINPVVTSDSSVDAYVVMRVAMPAIDDSGLYTINTGADWSKIESSEVDGKWVEVYLYGEALSPEASTSTLGNSVTMKDISRAEYGSLDDLNIEIDAYAVGTDNEEMEDAWKDIKAHLGCKDLSPEMQNW